MREGELVNITKMPNTVATLEEDFKKIGLKKGMTVIVHSSLSAIGWVSGREKAVVEALMNVVTEEGNIVVPTQSGELSDPKFWQLPAVPFEWWQVIRDTMPAFDPKTTPTRGMGKIVDCFRFYEGVKRSNHPAVSFAAWGKEADRIIENHQLAFGLGEASPLQKIYDLNGYVLLLGVNHDSNTSLHLAEYYSQVRETFFSGAPVIELGKRVWKEYEEFMYDDTDFIEIGRFFEENHPIREGKVGNATAKLMRQRELVDFGINWFKNNTAE